MPTEISSDETKNIEDLVKHFIENKSMFSRFIDQLRVLFTDHEKLLPFVHSLKWRLKDPEHLRCKLKRKILEAMKSEKAFDITLENLFEKINDLAGARILHLHTTQFQQLNRALIEVLEEARYKLIEGPIAYVWDDESRKYFQGIGVETKDNPRMYTSVHYVIEANTKSKLTCEIQVRTLAEELWGEVDHRINYPDPTDILACSEQIKVLARITSGCTRLVDSIFKSHETVR
jgi:putative GTP pyrophosphokinase